MKFTGEIRIPEVDHPGIPATILVEDTHIEVVLDGESLGRWSLVDVHARRLISSAFQLDLDGEEVTFIADEPIDFAYRGVEEMGSVWARINSLGPLKRTLAVRSSRSGVKPSRIAELRAAMEANLKVERRGFLAGAAEQRPEGTTAPSAETFVTDTEPAVPGGGEAGEDDEAPIAAEGVEADRQALRRDEAYRLAGERAELAEERSRLENERQLLEELRRDAEERDAQRIEAFRMEMARLEAERAEHLQIEAERAEVFRGEMEKLQLERERLERLEVERSARAGEDAARVEAVKQEMARLEEERRDMERAEAERVAAAEAEMEAVNSRRLELERMEAERVERERAEAEGLARLEAESAEEERAELERIGSDQDALQDVEDDEGHPQSVDDGDIVDSQPPQRDEGEDLGPPASSDGETDSAREVVVDLGVYEDQPIEPEPALAAVGREKAGFMGAVKSALTRGGRNHAHEFVEAPGGLGIARSICRECGFVSISSTD